MMMAFGDLGVGGAVVPLVGAASHDPNRVGNYIAAGRQLRRLLFPFVALGGALAFWVLGRQHGMALPLIFTLFLFAALAVWTNAATLFYSAPSILRQQIGYIQILQNVNAGLRLALYGLAQIVGLVNAALPLFTNSVLQLIQLQILKRKNISCINEPPATAPEAVQARKQMVKFLLPQLPILLFTTFQGQITVLLVSLIGSTAALAEIGALTRLNVLFASLAGFYGIIIVPYFSRIGSELATRRALQIFFGALGLLGALVLFGFHYPQPFLWVLGGKYYHLQAEIGWTLLSYGLGQIAGLLAAIVYARRIVPHLSIAFVAIPVISAQIIGVILFPPTEIHGAILLTLWTNLGSIAGHWVLYFTFRNKTTLAA